MHRVSLTCFSFYHYLLVSNYLFHFCLRIVKVLLLRYCQLGCLLKVAIFNDIHDLYVFMIFLHDFYVKSIITIKTTTTIATTTTTTTNNNNNNNNSNNIFFKLYDIYLFIDTG